ncbi:MAG: iron-sulfur cluster-binding protein [Chloroflexi bacterium]|nr:iron-sulfur cluster-binding protein [Chloroflexota bacterium]MCH7654719.1 iron-sulfur cluster-binding protein [Chloroflexota bacterium]
MAQVKSAAFKKASTRALHDQGIQHALNHVMNHFTEARASAIAADYSDESWDAMRTRAAAIKAHTIGNLDYYLDLADRSIRRNGGHVHFADDAADATRIVIDIAKRHDVKRAIKSKSMVSEEMGLNDALKRAGIDPVETDLGEYIIQLAGETPFHIIAPAMHKTREEVSDLFHDWLKSAPTSDIARLCSIAREALRKHFETAEMGITGANFVVAETGTVVIVTNEGNGRMVTSTPRVHVAICGMEKVLPAIEDLPVFLRLLPRSATGQRTTSYTSFISGPRGPSDEDGPEEFHLIFVDNGRLNLLKDEVLREALSCIRCGACLNHCPVYRKVGGHAYGWVYSGPIGAVVTGPMTGMKQAADLPFASTLCGACRDVCPVKIDLPKLLLHLRHRLAEGTGSGERAGTWMERLYIRRWHDAVKTRAALDRSTRLGRLLQKPLVRRGKVRSLPLPVISGWTKDRDFPALAPKSFGEIWRDGLGPAREPE